MREKSGRPGERGDEFVLNDDDFHRLHDESVLFYYRYLALFQVGHYDRVARDTEHNLGIGRMLEDHYKSDNRNEMLQYRPYIFRMNAISRAMVLLTEEKTGSAAQVLEKAKASIEALTPVSTPIFEFEKIRSLQHLSQVISQIRGGDEESPSEGRGVMERLAEELSNAVEAEDYERAARLRDRIRSLY